jgi:hypothetical protein
MPAAVFARLARAAIGGAAILLLLGPRPVHAQKLELTFDQGFVTLAAQDVTVRQVLDEWARMGGTRVVNADLLGGKRISLQLDRIPEAQAIERLLESAAGYVARRRSGTTGPSDFALILVLATGNAPAGATAATKDTDSTSPGGGGDIEPPPLPSPPALTSDEAPADLDVEPDPDETSASNEANGRAPGTLPFEERLTSEVVALPADQLPAGRPEGARPGVPVPAGVAAPTALTPPAAVPVGTDQAQDANGRPRKRP